MVIFVGDWNGRRLDHDAVMMDFMAGKYGEEHGFFATYLYIQHRRIYLVIKNSPNYQHIDYILVNCLKIFRTK